MNTLSTIGSIFTLVLLVALQAQSQHFDEMKLNGQFRPHYRYLGPMLDSLSPQQHKDWNQEVRRQLGADTYDIDLKPRVFTNEEFSQIQRGVDQRGRALSAFLQDYYDGTHTYERSGIISRSDVERMIRASFDFGFADYIREGSSVKFSYGPDLIRDNQGQWRVLEDNAGLPGGIADAKLATELFLKQFPQFRHLYQKNPAGFFDALVKEFKSKAGGKAVVFYTTFANDGEIQRLQKEFSRRGVYIIGDGSENKFEISQDKQVRIRTGKGALIDVGYVGIHSEFWMADPHHPVTKLRVLMQEIKSHLTWDQLPRRVRTEMESILAEYQERGTADIDRAERMVEHKSVFSVFEGKTV